MTEVHYFESFAQNSDDCTLEMHSAISLIIFCYLEFHVETKYKIITSDGKYNVQEGFARS